MCNINRIHSVVEKLIMKQCLFLLLLLFPHQSIGKEQDFYLSNETQHHLNELQYSHEITIRDDEAEFTFILFNITHAREVLGINSYFLSITFVDEEHHEQQLPIVVIESSNNSEYHGRLMMMYLEREGNYLVCVFFLNQSSVITSSRFCHVVSVASTCDLEFSEGAFNNRHAIILVAAALLLLIIIVVVSLIKGYKNRPRTMADRLKSIHPSLTEKLEALGTLADGRRRRQTQQELIDRLQEDSLQTIESDQHIDDQYQNYHGFHNASFSTIPE